MLRIDEFAAFQFLTVVGMLNGILDRLHRVGRTFRLEVLSLRKPLIPSVQWDSHPDVEEVCKVSVEEIVAERRICDG